MGTLDTNFCECQDYQLLDPPYSWLSIVLMTIHRTNDYPSYSWRSIVLMMTHRSYLSTNLRRECAIKGSRNGFVLHFWCMGASHIVPCRSKRFCPVDVHLSLAKRWRWGESMGSLPLGHIFLGLQWNAWGCLWSRCLCAQDCLGPKRCYFEEFKMLHWDSLRLLINLNSFK